MIFDSIRRGGNARVERGALERAGIRVSGDVLSGQHGIADAQEGQAMQMLLLRKRMEAEALLAKRRTAS